MIVAYPHTVQYAGKRTRKGRMMITTWRQRGMAIVAMLTGLIIMVGVVFGSANTAYAATLTPADERYHVAFPYNDMEYYVGVAGLDASGNKYYCIEAGKLSDYVIGPTTVLASDENARRMAWILDRYRDTDAATHAAIGIIVQDHFGRDRDEWARQMAVIQGRYPEIVAKAARIWDQSAGKTPAGTTVERTDAEALRSGSISVKVVNRDGDAIAGVPFTVTLQGAARFVQGGNTFSGVSTIAGSSIAWEATGAGEVTVNTTYEYGRMHVMDSTQDMLAFDSMASAGGSSSTFQVRKDFVPSVSTQVSDKVLDAASPVFDDVTSGVGDEGSHWVPGLKLQARGYYFDGLGKDDLGKVIAPNARESADAFLARLASSGYEPSAYGKASFTSVGQRVRVRAMAKPDGDAAYLTPKTGGFGTWVWVFRRSEQSKRAQEYLTGDWVSPFMEASESNVGRGKVEVMSTVTEHSADIGAELSDTITVSGFPADHGQFMGDETYGFAADQPYATVSVWWSGDPDNPSNDEAYKPSGGEVPTEDDNHRLLATWEIPAMNGTFKIGAGALDAHGAPMHLTAERHGWYVFVWRFEGDDRVSPASSRYDDAWERVRVLPPCESEKPCEPEKPETPPAPAEATTPNPRPSLPVTGGDVSLASVLAVSALAIGAILSIVVRWRRCYDRSKHWTMRWPIR